jgi:hypothetical protein
MENSDLEFILQSLSLNCVSTLSHPSSLSDFSQSAILSRSLAYLPARLLEIPLIKQSSRFCGCHAAEANAGNHCPSVSSFPLHGAYAHTCIPATGSALSFSVPCPALLSSADLGTACCTCTCPRLRL